MKLIELICLVALLAVGPSSLALTDKKDLPKGYSELCGRVTSFEKDGLADKGQIDGFSPTWLMTVTYPPSGALQMGFGISIDRKIFSNPEFHELIKMSLGKKVCVDILEISHFWLQAIRVQAD